MLSKSKVKYIQTLGQKKFREQEGMFIAEGPKVVAELIKAIPGQLEGVYALSGWINDNEHLITGIATAEIEEKDLEKISQLTTPNQVVAVVRQFAKDHHPVLDGKLVLALDDIRDPGNLGTIIRIADWFGINDLVCSTTCAEVYNPKVVQATMGSIARVYVTYTDLEGWLIRQQERNIFAAMLNGKDIRTVGKVKEGIVIIGNESQGIRDEIASLVREKITIPRVGEAESLNAAVATGIILSHLT